MTNLRSRVTYANVMATIAVFIALGGSSYAALRVTGKNVPKDALTGADIKNLSGRDVRNNSLTGADINESTLGVVPQATALAKVTYKNAAGAVPGDINPAVPTVPVATGTVACDAGQKAISGGVKVDNPAAAFEEDSFPDQGGTAWTVR